MSAGCFDVQMEILGAEALLESFRCAHLDANRFSFETLLPCPPSLNFELNRFVSEGVDAVFGRWQKLATHPMLRGASAALGLPFPLQSREQVIASLRALGELGELRLRLGQQFKSNMARYGYGHAAAWREANWGTETDAREVVASVLPGRIRVAFEVTGPPLEALWLAYSTTHPQLDFIVGYADEFGLRGRKAHYRAGEKIRAFLDGGDAISRDILRFRRENGLEWMLHISHGSAWIGRVAINPRGRAVFCGSALSVDEVRRHLLRGDSPASLCKRYPEWLPYRDAIQCFVP